MTLPARQALNTCEGFFILKKQRKEKRVHGRNVISFLYDMMEIFQGELNFLRLRLRSWNSTLVCVTSAVPMTPSSKATNAHLSFSIQIYGFSIAPLVWCEENKEHWITRRSRSNVRFLSLLINLHNSFSGQRSFSRNVRAARLGIQLSASRVAVKVKTKQAPDESHKLSFALV